MLLELNSPEFAHPAAPRVPEGPEMMQAFVVRHRPFFILTLLLVAQLLLLSFQITRNHNVRLIKVWTMDAFGPFDRSLRGMSDSATRAWRTYHGLWGAQQENQELEGQLVEAQFRIQQLSAEAAETERLRALLDFKTHLGFQTVPAEVIATSPGATADAVYIDKGADANLTNDLPVITPHGVVGKVVAVYPHTSQVLLVTDLASGVGAMLGRDHVQGVLKGAGDNLCRLDYIMNEDSAAAGQEVLTSGLDQIYPKGLRLGTVVKVGDGNIYKAITVKPAAELDRLDDVLVVIKNSTRPQEAAADLNHRADVQ